MKKLIKNISNANREYVEIFEQKIDLLDDKIKSLILSIDYEIVLVNKCSNVYSEKEFKELINDISNYKENYTQETIDKIFRGITSDTIRKICVFSETVLQNQIGFILYHEIGHFLDFYNKTGKFKKFYLSTQKDFVDAYKKDLSENWGNIKQDKRYRLIHLIQNSTLKNPNKVAMAETFANCFAKIMNEIDEFDFIDLYFKNSLQTTNKIINNFLTTPPTPTL